MGITREEFDKKMRQYKEKQNQIKNSGKYKQYMRAMKKHLYEQGVKPNKNK